MIVVLRLGHRVGRDDRISTHCGLVARALGALMIIYSGDHDHKMMSGILDINERFGGNFEVAYNQNWRHVINDFGKKKFTIVHLTAYGMPLQKKIKQIRNRNVLVVIGSEKMPGEVFQLVDHNIAVSNQPHSEVAALALFMHEYFSGKELNKKFKGKVKIVPQERGKKVVKY